ncbi:hypothetical protein DSM104299_02613 [Baekduia alba]|uniref:hypothetical protein n=1 Tax=Baekduia alba TaxID=2997333 RepID=UPI002341A955|nr:hypothetical protein [Baekduia alba]WCB93892.1 hypothetical protein DSM104299_02613 [Baekduia alba]
MRAISYVSGVVIAVASGKNFVDLAFLPLLGAAILAYVFVKATIEYAHKDGGYAKPFLGIGSPVVITIAMILIGLGWFLWRYTQDREFFSRKPEPVDPELAATVTHRVAKKEKVA